MLVMTRFVLCPILSKTYHKFIFHEVQASLAHSKRVWAVSICSIFTCVDMSETIRILQTGYDSKEFLAIKEEMR